jgi:hypothetical protein
MIILALISCKETKSLHSTVKYNKIDTTYIKDIQHAKLDTLVRTSKPFELNTILCYWENYIINNEEININLKNYNTKKVLINESLFVTDLDVDYNSSAFFNNLNNEFFNDLNFDGFKDFKFYSKGSMAMTSLTNIYLYNNKTQSYDYSEYLSAISIDEIDKKNRRLVTYTFNREYEIKKNHYFNKKGRLKYSELFTHYYSEEDSTEVYEKIINGKVVKTKKINK